MTNLFDGLFGCADACEAEQRAAIEDIPSDPVVRLLNRWAFNWRGERAVIEKELRELIASHPLHAESQHR